jgi:hypothetical protein
LFSVMMIACGYFLATGKYDRLTAAEHGLQPTTTAAITRRRG